MICHKTQSNETKKDWYLPKTLTKALVPDQILLCCWACLGTWLMPCSLTACFYNLALLSYKPSVLSLLRRQKRMSLLVIRLLSPPSLKSSANKTTSFFNPPSSSCSSLLRSDVYSAFFHHFVFCEETNLI